MHTIRGNAVRQRVDEPGFESFEGVRSEKALPVWSERLGLIGKCDVVEFYLDGRIYPVEYKHGKKRAKAHDDIQLAAQAICREEMTGQPVMHGAIFHHTSRRGGQLPSPVNGSRRKECSLKEICQPEALVDKTHQRRILTGLFNVDE